MAYEYANARLRAMKGRLFGRAEYDELLACVRLDDLVAKLAQSTYGDEIQAALARYVGARVVMEACRLNLATTLRGVRAFFDADGARLVGVLLARWDLFNLETILRAQSAGVPPEKVLEVLVPVGELDESALRSLVRQAEPAAVADWLSPWNASYAQAVRAALASARGQTWSAGETVLEDTFYERLLRALDPGRENDRLVREYLMREIDGANVLSALRLRGVPAPAGPRWAPPGAGAGPFVGGGELSREWLAALAGAAGDGEALAMLRASTFGPALAAIEVLDVAQAQRALDRDLAHFGLSFFTRDPLSMATAIGYMAAKTTEVKNVRAIAQGVALGLRRGEIEEQLTV